jgi:hypothetical protein
MNNVMFFHVATIGDYQQIVDRVFSLLKESNLFDNLYRIYVNIAGNESVNIEADKKIKIFPKRSPLSSYEFTTLDYIKMYAENKDANILYVHTKGCSTPHNPCIDDWREYMFYFNILKYIDALKLLEVNDAVGVDLVSSPATHFSGNIWWTKSSHINKLTNAIEQQVVLSERHKCEFWVCSDKQGKYASLHNSNTDVYSRHLTRLPRSLYENSNN